MYNWYSRNSAPLTTNMDASSYYTQFNISILLNAMVWAVFYQRSLDMHVFHQLQKYISFAFWPKIQLEKLYVFYVLEYIAGKLEYIAGKLEYIAGMLEYIAGMLEWHTYIIYAPDGHFYSYSSTR